MQMAPAIFLHWNICSSVSKTLLEQQQCNFVYTSLGNHNKKKKSSVYPFLNNIRRKKYDVYGKLWYKYADLIHKL